MTSGSNILTTLGVDPTLQYHSNDFKGTYRKLVLYPINKAIITDNSVIVDAFFKYLQKLMRAIGFPAISQTKVLVIYLLSVNENF